MREPLLPHLVAFYRLGWRVLLLLLARPIWDVCTKYNLWPDDRRPTTDDEARERLDAQRDTLLSQSQRISDLRDYVGVLEARISDQNTLIEELRGKAGNLARHARGLEKRFEVAIGDLSFAGTRQDEKIKALEARFTALEQRRQAPDQSMQ